MQYPLSLSVSSIGACLSFVSFSVITRSIVLLIASPSVIMQSVVLVPHDFTTYTYITVSRVRIILTCYLGHHPCCVLFIKGTLNLSKNAYEDKNKHALIQHIMTNQKYPQRHHQEHCTILLSPSEFLSGVLYYPLFPSMSIIRSIVFAVPLGFATYTYITTYTATIILYLQSLLFSSITGTIWNHRTTRLYYFHDTIFARRVTKQRPESRTVPSAKITACRIPQTDSLPALNSISME